MLCEWVAAADGPEQVVMVKLANGDIMKAMVWL